MKNFIVLILLFFYLSGNSQYINPTGDWQSSSGNKFSVWTTVYGIQYRNQMGQILNANSIGLNMYRVDFYNGPMIIQTISISVLSFNSIMTYTWPSGQTTYWAKNVISPQIYECGVSSYNFNFVYANQRNTNWCWAACIQMILNYYGVNISQEQVVYRTFGTDYWGNLPDWGGNISNIHANLNNWNIDNNGTFYSVSATFFQGAPNVEWLINELKTEHPVFIGYNTGTGHHAVLITGCTYGMVNGQLTIFTLTVRDPWPGNGKMIYNGYDLASRIEGHWYVRVYK